MIKKLLVVAITLSLLISMMLVVVGGEAMDGGEVSEEQHVEEKQVETDREPTAYVDPEDSKTERCRPNNDISGMVDILEEAFFNVTINGYDSEVVEEEDQIVNYTVANTGGNTTNQSIEFFVYDAEGEIHNDTEENVTLGGGQSHTSTFSWTSTNPGNYAFVVSSEDDKEARSFDVLIGSYFEVTIDQEVSDTEGVEVEDIFIVTDIENIGEEEEIVTQTIELYHENGTILDHQDVTLGPGQNERIYLIWETELGDAGNYTLQVVSEDDEDQIIVELDPPPDLNFISETWYIDGDEMDPEKGFELEEGDALTFEGQIKNEGGAPIYNALLEYKFPDGSGDSEHIDVEADETVNFIAEWNVRVIEDPEISIWVNSTAEDERTHDEIRYFEDDFEDIEPTVIRFEDLGYPEQEMIAGETYVFFGRVVRDEDDKPLADIDVTISIQSSPALISENVTTDENGYFEVWLRIPDGAAGEYTVEFEAHTHEVQSTQESVTVEEDDGMTDRVREIPGFTSIILLLASIIAVAIYHKKDKRT